MFICPKLQGLATVVSEPPDFVQKIAFIFNLSDLEILDGGLWSVTGLPITIYNEKQMHLLIVFHTTISAMLLN